MASPTDLLRTRSEKVSQNTVPLFSVVRFAATRTGAGPYTFTVAAGDRKAFSYAQGADMSPAGAAGVIATAAQTNLLKAGETPNNENVIIRGISIAPLGANSDPELIAQVMDQCSVDLQLGPNIVTNLGRIEACPSPYGVYGRGFSTINPGPLPSPVGRDLEYLRNGNPVPGTMLRLPDLRWEGAGSKSADTTLGVIFRLPSPIALSAAADRAAAAGTTAAFASPAGGIHADFAVFLHCYREALRSSNQ